jgi:hypothetical protein
MSVPVKLKRELEANHIKWQDVRGRNLKLMAVPVGDDFNKEKTNLYFRESHGTRRGGVEVYADEDLRYTGDDPARQEMLDGATCRGWQRLQVGTDDQATVEGAVRGALKALDSPLCQRISASPAGEPLPPELAEMIAPFGRPLPDDELLPDYIVPWWAQTEAILQTAETVVRRDAPRCPAILGDSGAGKTVIGRAAAAELRRRGHLDHVIELDGASLCAGAIFGPERDERLKQALAIAAEHLRGLVVFEAFDLPLLTSPVAVSLLTAALDRGVPMILVGRSHVDIEDLHCDEALARRLRPIRFEPPGRDELALILCERLKHHPARPQLAVAPETVHFVAASTGAPPRINPAAAIGALDAALTRAAWSGVEQVGPDDVLFALGQHHQIEDY